MTAPTLYRRILLLAICGLLLAPQCQGSDPKSDLPPRYRAWLNEEVPYIITVEERESFLHLASNDARDTFIEHFWAIRNPNPGAPTNSFKEEHYKRIAYANQFFGWQSHTPGWRTPQGRIYITLGAPKQKAVYYGYNKLRKMETWFYSNSHPALPPYFYIVFYQRDDQEEFRLYSPYMDGPERLVTTDSGSRAQSLHVIEEQAGREVARTALSLLPDEPVDFETARPTLQSDVLLSTIQGLANNALNKTILNSHRQILEDVSHRVVLGQEFLELIAVPLRDSTGNVSLHCLVQLLRPEDFSIGKASDGRFYYSVELDARVKSADGKEIYNRHRKLSQYFSEQEFQRVKDKAFALGFTLPITTGKYNLELTLTNKLRNTSFRSETQVMVPPVPVRGLTIPGLVIFSNAAAGQQSPGVTVPFSGGGVEFTPIAQKHLQLQSGQNLNFFYQIWVAPAELASYRGQKLAVDYAYGRVGIAGDLKSVHDEVDASQFDPAGSLINGKRISLMDIAPGNYRLVATITDPTTHQKAFTSTQFSVVPGGADTPQSWYVSDTLSGKDLGEEQLDRALCYSFVGDGAGAEVSLRRALEADPANGKAITKLVDYYSAKSQASEIVKQYPSWVLGAGVTEVAILRIADALANSGELEKSIAILEDTMHSRQPTGALYLALSNYYRQLGNVAKANEMERLARSLTTAGN